MSDAREKNDKGIGKEQDHPTASFSSSAPVVVHRTSRALKTF
ncbi:MAG: hypothetical protein ACYS9C_11805 [Planctomycetota bacterium]|jgi:hypothetical protein